MYLIIRQEPTLYYYFLTVNDSSSLFLLSDRTPPSFYMHGSIDIFILIDLIKIKNKFLAIKNLKNVLKPNRIIPTVTYTT